MSIPHGVAIFMNKQLFTKQNHILHVKDLLETCYRWKEKLCESSIKIAKIPAPKMPTFPVNNAQQDIALASNDHDPKSCNGGAA